MGLQTGLRTPLRPFSRHALHGPSSSAGGSAYDAAVLADSPAGFWPLNESSGTTAFDQSGHNNNGTYSGAFAVGGASLGTDGESSVTFTGGQMAVGNVAALALGAGNISVEALINPSALASFATLWDNGVAANRFYTAFLNAGAANDIWTAFGGQGGGAAQVMSTSILTGTRYHIVVTSNATTTIVYVNGSSAATWTQAAGASNSNTGVTFFGNPSGGGGVLQGSAAKFAVYNTVLSPARVSAHFAAI